MRSVARQAVLSSISGALCVWLGSARAHAQPAAPPAATPAAPACTGTLDGHAVDASTHEPVIGATVTVDGVVVGETDGDGRFVLGQLCRGLVAVEVERADYAVSRHPLTVPGATSVELELTMLTGEVILVEEEAPTEIDMRSTTEVSGAALARTRGRAFADTLAEVPGVTQLRSASGMAKPVIRGQYGRRLLILVDGVRHRAQEWGLDHAPEIDPFIADKLTVVRGASGVRYGPDAIGGAVLAEPPGLLTAPGLAGEAHLIGMSNGRGGTLAGRLQWASKRGLAGQLEGSFKRLAAPSTPDYALDNTGTAEWNLGATAGYRDDGDEYKLSYRHYQARLGVCSCLRIESLEDFRAQLEQDRPTGADLYTSDLEIERPYQAAGHDLALARATWDWRRVGTLTGTYSFQHDLRREYDIVRQAQAGAQFNFRLMTHEAELALDHVPIHLDDHLHLRGSAGVVATAQIHRYQGLPLVPDHTSFGAGAYAIERLIGHDFEVELGLRYDGHARSANLERQDFLRLVRSGQLAMDACGDAERDPVECASTFHTISASLGGLRQLTRAWSIKLDLSTASRPPSPDEQYLNGTAPTFPVLALGKPDLRPETTYSASATTSYQGTRVTAEASAYYNAIEDYIDFAPAIDADGNPIFDVLIRGTFPRFVTRAVDAIFYGVDGGVAAKVAPWLEVGGQVSIVRARNTTDRGYLGFVPADRARGSLTYRAPDLGGLHESFASVSGEYVTRQHRYQLGADLAPPPAGYFLLGAELGTQTRIGGHAVEIALQGSNLLATRYRDYTSLLRYFADQPGRQLMLRLSAHFSSR